MFDNILSNAAKYSAGDLTVTLTPDGAVTFANHAPNLSCVQANQLVDRFFTVETARARPGGGAGERGSGAAARRAGLPPAGTLKSKTAAPKAGTAAAYFFLLPVGFLGRFLRTE